VISEARRPSCHRPWMTRRERRELMGRLHLHCIRGRRTEPRPLGGKTRETKTETAWRPGSGRRGHLTQGIEPAPLSYLFFSLCSGAVPLSLRPMQSVPSGYAAETKVSLGQVCVCPEARKQGLDRTQRQHSHHHPHLTFDQSSFSPLSLHLHHTDSRRRR
jgi:hypothetical protein